MRRQALPPIPSSQAKKYLESQDKKAKERIRKAIESIPEGDIVPLVNSKGSYRLRKGDFRVIFHWVSDEQIAIEKISPRGNIYKRR